MVSLQISQAAFEVIPFVAPLSGVAYEAKTNDTGERVIWLAKVNFDRLREARRGRESYSKVILRLAAREVGAPSRRE